MSISKYENVFINTFEISKEQLPNLKYQDIESWDSVGHMILITALEEAFSIMLEPDDIVDFSSFDEGKTILKKYGVEL